MKIKFKNFCGIFATLFVTTTMVLLASCSQDDDYYESDMYTLAEMGTRLSGGDPGGGGPAPVITHVDSITILEEMCFYPNTVFNSSDFQHSPFVAIDPSLYGTSYIEADVWAILKRVDNEPAVASFLAYPSVMVFYPTPPTYMVDSIFGYQPGAVSGDLPLPIYSSPISISLSSTEFEVTSVYLQPDETVLPHKYTLYATGVYHRYDGGTVPCTAFVPNHIYN